MVERYKKGKGKMERVERNELKEFRKSKKMTQTEMAQKLEISLSHYKAIECGFADPSFKTLTKFYEVFKGQYDDIWKLFKKI